MHSEVIGEGREIIFVHGWTMEHREDFAAHDPVFEYQRGWRRHYLDLPGMGKTPPDPSITDADGFLNAVLSYVRWIVSHFGDGMFARLGQASWSHREPLASASRCSR